MIREKHIKSGKLFEADFFPVWDDGRRMPSRAPKKKPSTAAQAKYNKLQAVKKLVRLINANFDEQDVIMHPTYEQAKAPQSEEEARKDLVNYLRRVKNRRVSELKKVEKALAALPDTEALAEQRAELELRRRKLTAPFKYVYCIEKVEYKSGRYAGRDNWHFHLFVTGGLARSVLESMWTDGLRTNADNFQPEKYGPEAIAKYMAKDPQGSKRWVCSRNLDKPLESKPKDGKISRRGVARLAQERVDDAAYWENRYKGYKFVRCYSRFNDYNGHWYVSVVMYKADSGAPPRWGQNEWLTA